MTTQFFSSFTAFENVFGHVFQIERTFLSTLIHPFSNEQVLTHFAEAESVAFSAKFAPIRRSVVCL